MHNRLDGTPIRQKRHHDHNQVAWLTKPFQHGSPSCAKRVAARATAIALPPTIMNANVALVPFSSCQTRQIRAKLVRRVHWLWLVFFHTYSMPMNLPFFKPLPLHQLVGLYQLTPFSLYFTFMILTRFFPELAIWEQHAFSCIRENNNPLCNFKLP